MTRGFPQKGGRHGDDGLKIGREGLEPCFEFIDMAVEQDKPFYMWYAAFLPHTPHNPPERLLKNYRGDHPLTIAKYYAMIEWWDETCGDLVGYLEEKGIRDNTSSSTSATMDGSSTQSGMATTPAPNKRPTRGGIRQPTMYSGPLS